MNTLTLENIQDLIYLLDSDAEKFLDYISSNLEIGDLIMKEPALGEMVVSLFSIQRGIANLKNREQKNRCKMAKKWLLIAIRECLVQIAANP